MFEQQIQEAPMIPSESYVDVAILTVLPQEYQAVCDKITNLRPAPPRPKHPNMYSWQVGEVPYKNGAYSVAVGIIVRPGTIKSALAAVNTIAWWQPCYIFFVGIAGGLGGINKGDVVIADVIHGYEYGKIDQEFTPRGDWTYKTHQGLLTGAVAHAASNNWKKLIQATPLSKSVATVTYGEIASGDKVVDNPTNKFFQEVLGRWPKVKAVEMEGAGVGGAVEYAQAVGKAVGFMMIRGISDLPRPPQPESAEDKARGTQERDAWKSYAADTAAAFTISYIASGLPLPPASPESLLRAEQSREQLRIRAEKLTAYLERLGHLYRTVKAARRALRAGGLTTAHGNNPSSITKKQAQLYAKQMERINEAQLEFEGLKTDAESLPAFGQLKDVSAQLKQMEDYLRQILKEFEATNPSLQKAQPVEFSTLERLNEFTCSTKQEFKFARYGRKTDYRFKTHFSRPYYAVVKIVKEHLV
jgi:nucleoside phosphorylase